MKSRSRHLTVLIVAASALFAAARATTNMPTAALVYRFTPGEDFVVTVVNSQQQNQLSAGQVVSEGRRMIRQMTLRCKVEEVKPQGEATIAVTYAKIVEIISQDGVGLRIDSSRPVAESNPEFARLPRAGTDVPKLEQMRSMLKAMIGLSYKFSVSPSGRILGVTGFDDVLDAMREQFGAKTQDLAARAQLDALLEAFAGGDEGRQNAANLFVPFPVGPIALDQSWSATQTVPFVVTPLGQWQVPETRTYAIEHGGEPGQSALLAGVSNYGPPGRSGNAELEVEDRAFSYCGVLDPAKGGFKVREFHTTSNVNLAVYKIGAGASRQRVDEIQILTVFEVFWDPSPRGAPEAAAVCKTRGRAELAKGDPLAALDDFDQAILLNSGENEAYTLRESALQAGELAADSERAQAEWAKGDLRGAIDDFSAVIRLNPADKVAYGKRGWGEAILGHAGAAVADLGRSAELDPQNPRIFYLLGLVKFAAKDFDGSIAAMSRCIALDSHDAKAYFFRSMGWISKGDKAQGAADFDQAADLDPKVVAGDGAATLDEVAPLVRAFRASPGGGQGAGH